MTKALLALLMIASISTVAFAGDKPADPKPTEEGTVTPPAPTNNG